jgi:hypothetical protein
MGGVGSGGARIRSGPTPDPNSERSMKRGLTLEFLPPGGYTGAIPQFPLPEGESPDVPDLMKQIELDHAVERINAREAEVWAEVWRTPQAAKWATDEFAWLVPQVALYVRTRVRCEELDAKSGLFTQLRQLGNQIGLTPDGLNYHGWVIGTPEPDDEADPTLETDAQSARARVTRIK